MYITTKEMDRLTYQPYRKVASFRVRARRLTEEDVEQREGIIHSMEGPVAFQVGDYLAHGIHDEEYPIAPQAFTELYDESSMESDRDGFAWYRPANLIHQAIQIAEPFTVEWKTGETFTGKAGDYLVRTKNQYGGRIVDRATFEQTYERVEQ